MRSREFVKEAPLPPDWDPEQLNMRQTFGNRLRYALDRARRIGGGSSRVVMTIDYQGRPTALKVAKNAKGLAQNEAEVEILADGYAGRLPIVIPLIDFDRENPRPTWIQTEQARRVQARTLMRMLHTPNLRLLLNQARNILGGRREYMDLDSRQVEMEYFEKTNEIWQPTEQDWEIFLQYANELAELGSATSIVMTDLLSPSNWGVYNGRPVVLDLGFTEDTAQLYMRRW
jgi:hypothetical protein